MWRSKDNLGVGSLHRGIKGSNSVFEAMASAFAPTARIFNLRCHSLAVRKGLLEHGGAMLTIQLSPEALSPWWWDEENAMPPGKRDAESN